MKIMKVKYAITWTLLAFVSVVHGEARTWTSLDGKTAVAEFEELDGDILRLQKNGKTFEMRLENLSPEDRQYARTYAEALAEDRVLSEKAPLQIFEEEQYKGRAGALEPFNIYSGDEIPKSLNGDISSLILRKGYQAAIAIEADGGGLSKMLIAAQRDIRIPKLSSDFNDRIRFIRVLPWRNPVKKGTCGNVYEGLNGGWYYSWGGWGGTTETIQWVPMAYTRKWTQQETVNRLITIEGIQSILGYNEPEHMPQADADKKDPFLRDAENCAVTMKNLARTGLRIGSPSCAQQGPMEWLPEFFDKSKEHNCRIDFVGVHWYDWSNYLSQNDDSPGGIFNRFKEYLEGVHDQFGLPIWITEFNANPNRNNKIQMEFLEKALPWMDETPYIERYAYFEPFGKGGASKWEGDSNFRQKRSDTSTPLTPIGQMWRDHESVPAMSREVYLGENNLCRDEKEE